LDDPQNKLRLLTARHRLPVSCCTGSEPFARLMWRNIWC
jgi:hypothetical protein